LQAYSFLLDKRFGDKFKLKINLPTEWNETKIPPMALQLLVENAIQHNAITDSNPLQIEVTCKDDKICVSNDLNPKTSLESFGIGLVNLKKRYQLIAAQDIVLDQSSETFMVRLPVIQ